MPALTQANLSRMPPFRQEATNGLLPQFAHNLAQLLVIWDVRFRTRRALRQFDDARCRDIGRDPATVMAESARPFWKA